MSRAIRPLTVQERDSAKRLIAEVAADHGLEPDELTAPCRRADVVRARAEAVHRLWSTTDLTLRDIASLVGLHDHSSAVYLRNLYSLRWSA